MTLLRHLYIDVFITVLCLVYKVLSSAVYWLYWHHPEVCTECI